MKHFFLKTVLLSAALFICVLYGMETAKHNMMNMVGQTTNPSLNIVSELKKPLPKPSLNNSNAGSASKSAGQTASPASKTTSSRSQTATNDLSNRIQKLQKIQNFNPYSSLGESLSNGLQVTFSNGMTATSSLFDHLLKHVF